MSYSEGETFYIGRESDGDATSWIAFSGASYNGVTSAPSNIITFADNAGFSGGVFYDTEKTISIPSGGTDLYIRMKSITNTFPVLIKLEGGGSPEETSITNTLPDVWETIKVSFSIQAERTRLVIFPNFGNPSSLGSAECKFTTMRVGGSTMTLTYTNIPNNTSVNVPLSNASGLSSSVNESAITWPDTSDTNSTAPSIGSGTTITPSSLTFTNNTGSTYTAVVYLFVNTGYVGRIGGTWTNPSYLTSIAITNQTDWGLGYNGTSPGLTSLEGFIQDCVNCTSVPSSGGIPSSVTNLSSAFKGATSFNSSVASWNVSSVTDMSSMFEGATSFTQSFGGWENQGTGTANVRNMSNMFKGATSFNGFVSAFDVSSVTDMSSMFEGATSFNKSFGTLANRGTGTANVKNMSSMFKDATSFNGFVTAFDVSEVTDMSSMFEGATSYNRGLGNWANNGTGSANVTNFSKMFKGCTSLDIFLGSVIVTSAENMSSMFEGCTSMTTNLNQWASSLSNVTNMSSMFKGCTSIGDTFYINNWDVSSVTDMSSMFEGCSNFNNNGVLHWTTTSLTTMENMFNGATAFNQDIRVLDATNVTNYTDMFLGATAMIANFSSTEGWGTTPSPYWFNSNTQSVPCFLKGTMIETMKGMLPVEDLHKNVFVKTFNHSYVPITLIGKKTITHDSKKERNKEQLFVCKKELYPEATQDLIITGCHSLLVNRMIEDEDERKRIIDANGAIYLTDKLLRLPAVADSRTIIYPEDGEHEVYHFALDHTDERMNYGIYANGILAETCSNRYIKTYANLTLFD